MTSVLWQNSVTKHIQSGNAHCNIIFILVDNIYICTQKHICIYDIQ